MENFTLEQLIKIITQLTIFTQPTFVEKLGNFPLWTGQSHFKGNCYCSHKHWAWHSHPFHFILPTTCHTSPTSSPGVPRVRYVPWHHTVHLLFYAPGMILPYSVMLYFLVCINFLCNFYHWTLKKKLLPPPTPRLKYLSLSLLGSLLYSR